MAHFHAQDRFSRSRPCSPDTRPLNRDLPHGPCCDHSPVSYYCRRTGRRSQGLESRLSVSWSVGRGGLWRVGLWSRTSSATTVAPNAVSRSRHASSPASLVTMEPCNRGFRLSPRAPRRTSLGASFSCLAPRGLALKPDAFAMQSCRLAATPDLVRFSFLRVYRTSRGRPLGAIHLPRASTIFFITFDENRV